MAEQQLSRTDQIEKRIDKDVTGQMLASGAVGIQTFNPATMTQALEFAKLMAVSGKAIRKHLRDQPGTCLGIVMIAMRAGMDPFGVGNKTYEVNDQLAYEGQLVHAIINRCAPLQKSLDVSYTGEGDQRICHVRGVFKGETDYKAYDSPEFGKITPKNSPLWKSDKDQQQHFYSVRAWARRWCPEVLMGVYTPDDLEDAEPMDITPRPSREDYVPDADGPGEIISPDEPCEIELYDDVGILVEVVGPRAFTKSLLETFQQVKPEIVGQLLISNEASINHLREIGQVDFVYAIEHDSKQILATMKPPSETIESESEVVASGAVTDEPAPPHGDPAAVEEEVAQETPAAPPQSILDPKARVKPKTGKEPAWIANFITNLDACKDMAGYAFVMENKFASAMASYAQRESEAAKWLTAYAEQVKATLS